MHICFKIIKFFIVLYVALHVSDTIVSIIRSLPPLHMQPLVTVCCCVGCVLQSCSVVTALQGQHNATNTTTHGNQRLRVQWWKSPDDGHSSVRNM
jgi:hypothetical protein